MRTVVPMGEVSTWNSSINRRVPIRPIPRPVYDLYRPSRIFFMFEMPDPESETITSSR